MACTRWIGALRSSAWLAWAWRIQCGRDFLFQAGLLGGGVDDAADLGDVERSAALAAPEDGVDRLGFSLDGEELLPDLGLEQNRAGFAALAENGDLPAFLARQGIAPLQPADLADPNAGDVEQLQQNPIAARGGGVDQPGHFALFENALCEGVPVAAGVSRRRRH